MTALLSLLVAVGAASPARSAKLLKFSERLLADVQRENAPWRRPPLVFLTDEDHGVRCHEPLTALENLLAHTREHLILDVEHVRHESDLWRLRGAPVGYLDGEAPTAFERFVARSPSGLAVIASRGNAWGAQLVAEWLGEAIVRGEHVSQRGTFDVRGLTFVFEMPDYTQLAPGVAAIDLSRHAVATGTFEGCTYYVVNRLGALTRLGCQSGLSLTP